MSHMSLLSNVSHLSRLTGEYSGSGSRYRRFRDIEI